SSALTATGVGAKTLTLQGSTAGAGELGGAIIDSSSGATIVTKTGSGSWTLSSVNTFSGALSVQAGTLAIGTINNASANGTLGNSAAGVTLGASGATGTLEYTGGTAS